MTIQLDDFRKKVENLFCESLKETNGEKEIDALIEFIEKISQKENNCFDFVSHIFIQEYNDDLYVGMTIFIEPIGYTTLYGDSFNHVLNGWEKILLEQPNEMDYKEAGFFILNKNQSFLEVDQRTINIVNINTNVENYWVS